MPPQSMAELLEPISKVAESEKSETQTKQMLTHVFNKEDKGGHDHPSRGGKERVGGGWELFCDFNGVQLYSYIEIVDNSKLFNKYTII